MTNKKLNIMEQAKLLQIYEEMYKIVMDLLKKYDDPQLVASTLIGQGFRLYLGLVLNRFLMIYFPYKLYIS